MANCEIDNISFTELDCIEKLIVQRSRLDEGWGLDIDEGRNVYVSQGTPTVDEDVMAAYSTLDDLIAKCKFNSEQTLVLNSLMDGNTADDVAKLILFKTKDYVKNVLKKCAIQIKKQNDDDYEKWLIRNGLTMLETKVCTMCGRERLIENFYEKKYAKDGRQKICKDCRMKTERIRYEENKRK